MLPRAVVSFLEWVIGVEVVVDVTVIAGTKSVINETAVFFVGALETRRPGAPGQAAGRSERAFAARRALQRVASANVRCNIICLIGHENPATLHLRNDEGA